MPVNFDNESIEFPCGKCGRKFKQTVGWLKRNKDITCPSCGTVNVLDSKKLTAGLDAVKKRLDKF